MAHRVGLVTHCQTDYIGRMAEKTARMALRLRPEIKDALERAARADGRSLSAMVERIAAEWLRANPRGNVRAPFAKQRATARGK